MSFVSVVIPAYNAEAFIAQAMGSAIAQTYRNLELIVLDDGSTDRTLKIAREIAKSDQRVRVLTADHRGFAVTINRGLAEARGDYIKFLDADDCLSPTVVASQMSRTEGRQDVLISAGYRRFYGTPEQADPPMDLIVEDRPADEWLFEALRSDKMIGTPIWLIPRKIIEIAGPYDERLSSNADHEFLTRALLNSAEVLFAPDSGYFYRCGLASSLSLQRTREAAQSRALSTTLITQHLLDYQNTDATRRICANLLQAFIFALYPDHPDLRAKVAKRVSSLGGSNLKADGPPGFRLLRILLGWRLARRVERRAVQYGFNRGSIAAKLRAG